MMKWHNDLIKLYLTKEELDLYKKIIVNSIKTRIEKINSKGAIVALSGGIDSSLVTTLAHEALGKNVLALILPEEGLSPEEDLKDAQRLCEKLGVAYRIIPINQAVNYFTNLSPQEKNNRLSVANVKPRVRMIINYLFANLENKIVLGTSNKTELLLGYGTKFGDMAADLYPIGDLYKTQIWQLAEHLGMPTQIIRKKPSAGLWRGQTDEEELGHTYEVIDKVLFSLVELELSVREVSEFLEIKQEAVNDIYTRILQSEHKRTSPTITRVSKMVLDKDWRYPTERY